MKYSNNVDYLISSIIYLGTHNYWWGRTPVNMAKELGMDGTRLANVLAGFPGLFRRSKEPALNNQYYYSLQARYAQYDAKEGEEPETLSDIAPVNVEKLKLLLDFVLKMAEQEKMDRRGWITGGIAVAAAVIAAIAAVTAAFIRFQG
jgi:hypothetical protein